MENENSQNGKVRIDIRHIARHSSSSFLWHYSLKMAAIAEELASSIDDGCYITTRWLAFKHNIKMTEAEK